MAFLVALCLFLNVAAMAQQSMARERGITLFTNGDTKAAINALTEAVRQDKSDSIAWRYLGLAFNKNGDAKAAQKAFERAVKLRDDDAVAHAGLAYTLLLNNKTTSAKREASRALELAGPNAEAHYIIGLAWLRERDPTSALEEAEIAIQIDPKFSRGFLLKSEALIETYLQFTFREATPGPKQPPERVERDRAIFKRAAESLSRCLELNPHAPEADTWRQQVRIMNGFAQVPGNRPSQDVFLASEVDRKARIISKPEPQYTSRARDAGVVGLVILSAVFAEDGTVKDVVAFRSLRHGLTENAVEAAKRIKFEPAVKDGRPVALAVIIEYYFNLY